MKDDRVCAAGGSVGVSHTEHRERLPRSLPDGVRQHGIDVAAAPSGALGGGVKHRTGGQGGGLIRGLHQPGPLKIPASLLIIIPQLRLLCQVQYLTQYDG